MIKKVKSTVPWTYVISYSKNEEIVGTFYEKELHKTNQKESRKAVIYYNSIGKIMVIHIILELTRKVLL